MSNKAGVIIIILLVIIAGTLLSINGFLHDIVDTRLVNIQNFLETIKSK